MTPTLVAVLAATLGALVAAVQLVYVLSRLRSDKAKFRIEEARLEIEREAQSLERTRTYSELETRESADRVYSSVNLLRGLINEIQAEIGNVNSSKNVIENHYYTSGNDNAYAVVSELTHALRTPLAHLASRTSVLRAELDRIAPYMVSGLDDMRISVDMCNDSLTAYQELSRVSSEAESWTAKNLHRAITEVFGVYRSEASKNIGFHVSAPEEVASYSNGFLLALVSPLIENAIEAAPADTVVMMEVLDQREGNEVEITIGNRVDGYVDTEAFDQRGKSSKDGHVGLGVGIARRLVSSQRGGTLTYSQRDDYFEVEVLLPGRISS